MFAIKSSGFVINVFDVCRRDRFLNGKQIARGLERVEKIRTGKYEVRNFYCDIRMLGNRLWGVLILSVAS